jgi:hypothetical protein
MLCGSLSPRVADGGDLRQIWRVAANSRQGVVLWLGGGARLTTPHCKKKNSLLRNASQGLGIEPSGISWLAEWLLASAEGLCSMGLILGLPSRGPLFINLNCFCFCWVSYCKCALTYLRQSSATALIVFTFYVTVISNFPLDTWVRMQSADSVCLLVWQASGILYTRLYCFKCRCVNMDSGYDHMKCQKERI